MLIAVMMMAASHVHVSLDIQEMEQHVKVNMLFLLVSKAFFREQNVYLYTFLPNQILMNVLWALIPVTRMLIAVTTMAASHVHATLDIQGMGQCVKV